MLNLDRLLMPPPPPPPPYTKAGDPALNPLAINSRSNASAGSSNARACGLWVVQVHHAFVDYLDSGQFRTGCFKPFLVTWMAERGVSDLKPLEGTPAVGEAAARNMAFITAFRHEARDDLAAAAAAGRLAWAEEAAPAPAVDSELERRDEADVA